MGDSSQAQLMVKDQEPIAALEGMEKMAEAKSRLSASSGGKYFRYVCTYKYTYTGTR